MAVALERIITVGLAPAWDVRCFGSGLDWGLHARLDRQVTQPAGKALNVSRALAWLGRANIAAGLWGANDYAEMLEAVSHWTGPVDVKLTPVPGQTRHNVTVIDVGTGREMHLRAANELITPAGMTGLRVELERLVDDRCVCVFAGAMPGDDRLESCLECVRACGGAGVRLVIDTYGPALRRVVEAGGVWVISPNLGELQDLLGTAVDDEAAAIVAAARPLTDRVDIVVVSRGSHGAVAVAADGAFSAEPAEGGRPVVGTVACGDYLLAGVLDGLAAGHGLDRALAQGVAVGSAHAWGWSQRKAWRDLADTIRVETHPVD